MKKIITATTVTITNNPNSLILLDAIHKKTVNIIHAMYNAAKKQLTCSINSFILSPISEIAVGCNIKVL